MAQVATLTCVKKPSEDMPMNQSRTKNLISAFTSFSREDAASRAVIHLVFILAAVTSPCLIPDMQVNRCCVWIPFWVTTFSPHLE